MCGAVIAWEKGCQEGRERGSVIRVCGTGIAGKAAGGKRGKRSEGAWWHNRMPESYGML